MKVRRVLVVYKKSAYQIYVLERRNPLFVGPQRNALDWDIQRLKRAHDAHQHTLADVQRVLRTSGVRYRMIYRAMQHDYAPYDLVIAVGGDGTCLEAARSVTRQLLLGVNSDPDRSTGTFCRANAGTFERVWEQLLNGGVSTRRLNRLRLVRNGTPLRLSVLNDVLVAHENPAAMSRYRLHIQGIKEEHRSSGIWVSTAAGSTAAMKSAGGRVLPRDSKAIEYLPRELYAPPGVRYRLRGGVLPPGTVIELGSLMREGMIYVDGEHRKVLFRYGDRLRISGSPYPLTLVDGLSRA